jgi:hypothetical protein
VSRYAAPFSFVLVAIWAVVVFAILAAHPQKDNTSHQTTTSHASK